MTFAEAFKAMLEGRKIKRPVFNGYWYLHPETGVATIHLSNDKEITYGNLNVTIKNCAATDWEIVEE